MRIKKLTILSLILIINTPFSNSTGYFRLSKYPAEIPENNNSGSNSTLNKGRKKNELSQKISDLE